MYHEWEFLHTAAISLTHRLNPWSFTCTACMAVNHTKEELVGRGHLVRTDCCCIAIQSRPGRTTVCFQWCDGQKCRRQSTTGCFPGLAQSPFSFSTGSSACVTSTNTDAILCGGDDNVSSTPVPLYIEVKQSTIRCFNRNTEYEASRIVPIHYTTQTSKCCFVNTKKQKKNSLNDTM